MGESKSAWLSYRLRKATQEQEVTAGAFGGHPRGIRSHQWPRCRVCGAPMCHMAQIDGGPWVDLGGYARMTIFICHAQGGRCEDWDPWKGANKVMLHRTLDDNMYDGPPTVRVYRRMRLTVDGPLDEAQVMREVKDRDVPLKSALAGLKNDKLGGGAVWLHGDDTPQSPTTRGPMRLALQLTTDLVAFDITKGGMAYVFLDPFDPSEDGARMLWQGG